MFSLPTSLNYCRPSLGDGLNQGSPNPGRAYPIPGQLFRAGDFIALATTGTLTYPAPSGSIAAVQPQATPTVTLTTSGSAGAQVYYWFYTYEAAGPIESLPSAWYVLVVPAGQVATITIPAAGAPAAATNFNLYIGFAPYVAWQQVAATALGSAATVPNPLTNFQGAQRAATNASGNIIGLVLDDYDVLYQQGVAQAITTNRRLFGADQTQFDPEQYQVKYAKLTNSQPFIISVIQPFNAGMIGSTFGLNYTSQGVFALDNTQSNKLVTVISADDNLDNWPASSPFDTGITGVQAVAAFTSGVLA